MSVQPADHGTPSRRRVVGSRAALSAVVSSVASALLLVTLIGATPASAATAAASDRVTFGIEPASATAPDGRPGFSFGMTPGSVLFDHVAVVNYSTTPLSLQLYATDAFDTSDGGFGLLQGSAKPIEVGAWISLPPSSSTVQVPPETPTGPGYVIVPMTVHVPASASPGDHVGGVIASLRTVGTNRTGQSVVLNQRIGTRVFVRVAGTLSPQLTVSGLHATYSGSANPVADGKVRVSYIVQNTGNADLAVHGQQVSVSGLIGGSHTVQVANLALLLPGAKVTQSAVVAGVLPALRLHVSASLDPVVFGGSQSGLSPVSASTSLWVIPWLLVVLILLILVIVAALWARRRSRSGDAGGGAAEEPETEGSAPKEEVPA